VVVAGATAVTASAATVFSEGFEGSLAEWTGRGGGSTSGVIVGDPIRPANRVLSFGALGSGGDIFSKTIAVTKSADYRLSFDFLGQPDAGGGIVGVALGTPGHHRWLAGTAGPRGAGEVNPLILDGKWHRYAIEFSPGDHTWFTFDGGSAVDPGAITSLRIMIEQNWGTPGNALFDNVALSTPPPDEPLPPVAGPPDPVVGRTANVAAVKPGVLVREPGSSKFVALSDPAQIKMGSTIDARTGRVRISIANGKGGVDTADFFEGVFRLTQGAKGTRFATLALVGGSFTGCPRAPKARLSAKPNGRSVRHLWGTGTGNFRTVGRFSAASLRGTTWLTDDKCNGTLTRVTKGSVAVRDFVRRRNVVVKAPGRYLARL
jgi:hypothetical protein